MAIVFECPVCEFQGKAADEHQGKQITCKGCGHPFTLPAAGSKPAGNGAAAAPAAESAKSTKAPAATTAKPTPALAPAEMVVTRCPVCGTYGKVPAAARGKKVKCPKCGEGFLVAPAAAPLPPLPSGPAARLSDSDGPPEQPNEEPAVASELSSAPVKALEQVPAAGDVDLKPLEGAEVVEEEETGSYELVDDAAILIDAVCPGCGHKGNVPQKLVGKKVKCPRCTRQFTVADPNQSKKGGTAPPPPAPADDANPFASLGGESPAAKAKATAAAPKSKTGAETGTSENPFAFDAPAAPKGRPRDDDPDRPAPRPRRSKTRTEEAESRMAAAMIWATVGISAVALLVGGFFAIRLIGSGAAKDTGNVTQTRTPDTDRQADKAKPEPPPAGVKGKTGDEPWAKRHRPVPIPDKRPELPPDLKLDPEPKPDPDPKADPAPDKPPPPVKEGTWVDASRESVQVGDVKVRVNFVWVDQVKSPAGVSPKKFLLMQLQLENTSADKQATYRGWSHPELVPGKSGPARLTDDTGKVYKVATRADTIVKPEGQIDREFIMPEKTLDDVLVFEPVTAKVDYLRLELPAMNLGGSDKTTLGLQIPGTMVIGAAPAKEPVGKLPDQLEVIPVDKATLEKIQRLRAEMKQGLRAQRQNAIRALGDLGQAAAPAMRELIEALRDRDDFVRAEAADALGRIGPPAAKIAINPLIRALGDNFFKVQANAAQALAAFGPDAAEAVPELIKLTKSKEEEVPTAASLALSKIDPRARTKPPPKVPPPKVPPPKVPPPPPPKKLAEPVIGPP